MSSKQPILCLLTGNHQLVELCFEYWDCDPYLAWSSSASSIAKKYSYTQYQLSQTVKNSSFAARRDQRCARCCTPYTCTSRSAYQTHSLGWNRTYLCPHCQQAEAQDQQRQKLIAANQRFAQIKAVLGDQDINPPKYNLTTITQEHAAYLYTILRSNNANSYPVILEPIRSQPGSVLPTIAGAVDLFKLLKNEGIITPSIYTDIDKFEITEDGLRYFTDQVRWIVSEDTYGMPLPELMDFLEFVLQEPQPDDAEKIWNRVALDECLQCFDYLFDEKYRFNRNRYTNKVENSINHCLEKLSIAQTKNILFSSMKNIAALMQDKTKHQAHVYNMIPGDISRRADRYIANNYNIEPYRRSPSHHEAWLTSFFFDSYLKGGTKDYDRVNRSNIRNVTLDYKQVD